MEKIKILSSVLLDTKEVTILEVLVWALSDPDLERNLQLSLGLTFDQAKIGTYFKKIGREQPQRQIGTVMKFSTITENNHFDFDPFVRKYTTSIDDALKETVDGFEDFEYVDIDLIEEAKKNLLR